MNQHDEHTWRVEENERIERAFKTDMQAAFWAVAIGTIVLLLV